MTDEKWFSLISDLLKIGIPSLVTIVVLYITNSAARERQLVEITHRERLEDSKVTQAKKEEVIYCIFSFRNIIENYFNLNFQYLSKQGIDLEVINSEIAKKSPQQTENIVRINMLVGVYFPSLIGAVNDLTLKREILVFDIVDHMNRNKYIPPILPEQLRRIEKEYDDVHSAIKALTQEVLKVGEDMNLTSRST